MQFGFENQVCPSPRLWPKIGEWWTLLILREAFFGTQRSQDFSGAARHRAQLTAF